MQVLEQPLLNQQLSRMHNISQVSALLHISAQALEDTQQEGLQPADMVSLIQLLSLAADVPPQPFYDATNYSQESIQELTQHFVSVADSIINEDNTNKWQAIREVAYTVALQFLTFFSHTCYMSNPSVWNFKKVDELADVHQQSI